MENNTQPRETKQFLVLTEDLEIITVDGLSTHDPEQWYIPSRGASYMIGYSLYPVNTDRSVIRDAAREKFRLEENRYLKRKRNLDSI